MAQKKKQNVKIQINSESHFQLSFTQTLDTVSQIKKINCYRANDYRGADARDETHYLFSLSINLAINLMVNRLIG